MNISTHSQNAAKLTSLSLESPQYEELWQLLKA
jgi:hypothetical protein